MLPATNSASASWHLTAVNTLELYGRGYRYDTYDIAPAGLAGGRVTRLQVFTRPGSKTDLAVILDGPRLASVEPVHPVSIAGVPFTHLPRLAALLKQKEVDRVASPLAAVFRALPAALRFDADRQSSASVVPPTTPYLTLSQPGLPLGSPLPGLDGPAAGRPAIVFFGELSDSRTRGMLRASVPMLQAIPGLASIAILSNTQAHIARWEAEQNDLAGKLPALVADPDRKRWPAFQPPILPYLFVFDRRHRLVFKSFWSGPARLKQDLAECLKEN